MNWLEIAAICAVLIGVGAAGFLVAQRPSFWYGLAAHAIKEALPVILTYVAKRNPPNIEKEMQECLRRGGEWDNFRKRCKR